MSDTPKYFHGYEGLAPEVALQEKNIAPIGVVPPPEPSLLQRLFNLLRAQNPDGDVRVVITSKGEITIDGRRESGEHWGGTYGIASETYIQDWVDPLLHAIIEERLKSLRQELSSYLAAASSAQAHAERLTRQIKEFEE